MRKISVLASLVVAASIARISLVASPGCGAGSATQELNAIGSDVIDCAKAEGATLAKGLTIEDVYTGVMTVINGAISTGIPGAIAAVGNLIVEYGGEIVGCIIDNFPDGSTAAPAPAGSGSTTPPTASPNTVLAPRIADIKQALLAKYWPGKTFKHPPHKK